MTVARVKGALVIGRTKALLPVRSNGLWGIIRESFTGAWQKNVEVDSRSCVLAFSAVYACVSIISNDIAKLRCKLTELTPDGIWVEVLNSPFCGVLRKPNRFQTRIQFFSYWVISLLLYGNTYVLKERDKNGIVRALYVLQGDRVTPCVANDGSVWYQLHENYLAGCEGGYTVPASEIIHDRMNCLWHPLVGISPIYACGASATQGNRIQAQSAKFFENMSRPSGMLTAPGAIDDETAARLKIEFEKNLGGGNIGRLLVAGSSLKYEPMTMPAVDAQLIEQLKWTVEDVARCFRVPLYMIDAGPIPGDRNIEAMQRMYYTQTLQAPIEGMEVLLDEGLELNKNSPQQPYATEFDLDQLLRMDTTARYAAWNSAVSGQWLAPNEARMKENLAPVKGGEQPLAQLQYYQLSTLAGRPPPDQSTGGAPAPGSVPALPAPDAPNPDATPDGTAPDDDSAAQGKSLTEYEILVRTAEHVERELIWETA